MKGIKKYRYRNDIFGNNTRSFKRYQRYLKLLEGANKGEHYCTPWEVKHVTKPQNHG